MAAMNRLSFLVPVSLPERAYQWLRFQLEVAFGGHTAELIYAGDFNGELPGTLHNRVVVEYPDSLTPDLPGILSVIRRKLELDTLHVELVPHAIQPSARASKEMRTIRTGG